MNIGYDANVFHGKFQKDCYMMVVIRCKSKAVVLRYRVKATSGYLKDFKAAN
jgi:hypothetical protein